MRAPSRSTGALAGLLALLLVLLGSVSPVAAHPLGNFTVNRYAALEVSARAVRVTYVLDLAEVPAFQARDEVVADPQRYREEQVAAIEEGLLLEVEGRPVGLRPLESRLTQPAGQGGLSTIRIAVLFEGQLPDVAPDEELEATFADRNGAGRIGWREIVVRAAGDAEVVEASVPAQDLSDALRSYPEDRLRSPLDVSEATFRFTPGDVEVDAPPLDAAPGGGPAGDRFTELLDRQRLTPLALAGMLAVAALVGVGHALAPGHGKTVMAAYLIGTRGRPVDAVLLGVIVSAMHTTSVLVLGLALHQLDERFALDRIYPVLTLASGVGVLLVGIWLATTRLRTYRRSRSPQREHTAAVAGTEAAGAGPVGRLAADARIGVAAAVTGPPDVGPAAHGHGHDLLEVGGVRPGRHDHDEHDHDEHDDDRRDQDHGDERGGHDDGDDQHGHGDDQPGQERAHDHERGGHGHGDGHHHDHGVGAHPHDEHRTGQAHGHGHGHGDGHEHQHEHEHHAHGGHRHGPGAHTHDLPEGVAPLSKRGLVLLATAGGVVPSPSAVIVLVSAFTLGRIGLGLALVAAFSIGLAATLTAVGLALVLGSRAIGDRSNARLVRVFPVLGAAALLVLGLILTFQGLRDL